MSKESFYNEITKAIKMRLGEDFVVKIHEVVKVNITLDGLTISTHDSKIIPTIYLNEFYTHYNSGRSMDSILNEIILIYETNRQKIKLDLAVNDYYDFDKIKSNVAVKVINASKNEELRRNYPHVLLEKLDLAVIFYVNVFWSEEEEERIGFLIRNEHLKLWKIAVSQLLSYAVENSKRLYHYTVTPMMEVLHNLLSEAEADEQEQMQDFIEDDFPMYILRAEGTTGLGANPLYIIDPIKKFADKCNCDIIILPSSIHELILLRADSRNHNVHELEKMVREVNKHGLKPEDFLSDFVYYYSRSKNEITIMKEDAYE